MISEIVRIEQFGLLTSGLRNIRCSISHTKAVFDLVPEMLIPRPAAMKDDEEDAGPVQKTVWEGALLVAESPTMLRLEFDCVLGVAVDTDIDVDLFGGLQNNWGEAPYLDGVKVFYPLLEIKNSLWKTQLPEWRRRDDPDIRHIRMISAECSFDVLGELSTGLWMENAA